MSLRRRLTVTLLLTFGLLLGAGGGAIYLWAWVALHREFDAALRVRLQAVAAFTKPTHDGLDLEFLRRFQREAGVSSAPGYFEVFDAGGGSIARSTNLGTVSLRLPFGDLGEMRCADLTLPDGTPGHAVGMRFLAKPPPPRPKPAATNAPPGEPRPPPAPVELGLVVAESLAPLREELSGLATIVLMAGGLTLLATLAIVPVVLRRGLAPLARLGEAAQRMDAASLQTRFPDAHLPRELVPIAGCLNDLLARLESSFERERRFSADLAHELRTPIAGLRTTAEVALRYGEPADRESFESVLDLARQMESLVTRLLALARSERAELPIQPQTVAVADVVKELWPSLADRAARRRLTARFAVPAGAALRTDPALFKALVANLVTNAVEYAAEGGDVRLRFASQAGRFELAVVNSVRDLEPADVERLFDRFWRKDRSRHEPDHAGLGLPLARSFATLLGLELKARLAPEDHLSLVLTGPLEGCAAAACENP